MNDKLRSILHTSYNEPRHFFFWLAMLSICGFIAAAGGAALTSPTTLLACGALGFILCFVVSILAFILAWIPPVRRLITWLLRRRFLVLGCLVTLVALFNAVEDWRGRRAWQSYKRAWEAKGERFDLASLAPPPVPNDQNFFETPLWADMHFVSSNRSTVWSDTNWGNRVIFTTGCPKNTPAPSPGSWIKAQRVDLQAWQAYYRGSNNLFAAEDAAQQAFRRRYGWETASAPLPRPIPPSGPPTNYFPVAKQPQAPAADVLLALSRFNGNRQLLVAAAARPQARFWINYDAGFAAMLPHLSRLKMTSQYLSLHATAALKAGDTAAALEDLKLSFRLIESIRSEPIVISHLVRIAMLQIALQPVWEGLADRQWTEADLRVLESQLGGLDFLADYHLAMRCERAADAWLMDYFRKRGIDGLNEMYEIIGQLGAFQGSAEWKQFLGKATFPLIPAGWFDQNKLTFCLIHEQRLLPLVDQAQGIVPPAAVQHSASILEQQGWRPYDMFSRLLLHDMLSRLVPGGMTGVAEKCAFGQNCANLALLACALERYRLANGQFPNTLDALAPKFIAKLPHDVINGQPLKYRRTDDGQFVLYSVGWNETDDGGTVGLNKEGKPDWHEGDWVWRYPAR
jgi:hypothetical protein